MATVKVLQKNFVNEAGENVPYERLAIIGYVSGEIHTLELKLSSSELMLAKMLLSSNEEQPTTHSHSATEEEKANFEAKNASIESAEESEDDGTSWLDKADVRGKKK